MRVEDAVKWLRKRLADANSFDGIDRRAIVAIVGDAEQREFKKKEDAGCQRKKK